MPDRISGSVARLLNDRELVINRGATHGVEVGMRFANSPRKVSVSPIQKEGLKIGDVERPKTLVKVTQVQEKLAVASTYRTKTVGGDWIARLPMFRPQQEPEEIRETLRAETSEFARPLKKEESYVQLGDRAVQVVGDEFAGWNW